MSMTASVESQSGPPADATAPVRISVVLQRLHDDAQAERFTPGWLMTRLGKRSYGIIRLLLSLVAIAPGISIVAVVPTAPPRMTVSRLLQASPSDDTIWRVPLTQPPRTAHRRPRSAPLPSRPKM